MMTPVSWSSSYLLREPVGISTTTRTWSSGCSPPPIPPPVPPPMPPPTVAESLVRLGGARNRHRTRSAQGPAHSREVHRGGEQGDPHPRRVPAGPRARDLRIHARRGLRKGLPPFVLHLSGTGRRQGPHGLQPALRWPAPDASGPGRRPS